MSDHTPLLMLETDEVALCADASGLEVSRVAELAERVREDRRSLVHAVADSGGVDEANILTNLARALDLPYLSAPPNAISPEVLERVPASYAIAHHVVPLDERDGGLRLACGDPLDWRAWDELRHLLGVPIERVLATRALIAQMLKAHYGLGAETVERLMVGREENGLHVTNAAATNLSDEDAANEPTVVNLVNKIVSEAILADATDIHLEPYDSKYRVRYRIDGMLEDVSIPVSVKYLKTALVSRIKIMANLDITEKRMPQDGRARVTLKGMEYDLRVSVLPGVYGEAVNARLQSRQMVRLELAGLGYQPEEQRKIERLIDRPHGLILVTGPTGSGKTTTLYTCLNRINRPETKIITIEDPVEYWMDDILQMQVHEEIGFDFARALRSMLRHDPDVMLVGEIRDRETADIAIRSALTGHLVFATLHTNDAASAASRLLDIGIEPFLAASSLCGVIAQRLVRRVCPHCKREVRSEGLAGVEVAWEGRGCAECRHTGYRGRTAIAEVLPITATLRDLIQQREPADRVKEVARREGMATLRASAVRAVRDGRTSAAEAMRATQEDG